MTVFVDSDIIIEVTRARNADILSRWQQLSNSNNVILYSPVTAAEVWAGARPREFEVLETLFRILLCVPIDVETGRMAGDYLRLYTRSHGMDIGDALIAAGAVLSRAVLWTRNLKHYPMKELVFY